MDTTIKVSGTKKKFVDGYTKSRHLMIKLSSVFYKLMLMSCTSYNRYYRLIVVRQRRLGADAFM